MVRILTSDDVRPLLKMTDVLTVVEDAIVAQGAGRVERPDRPHFPVGYGLDVNRPLEPMGTGLVMSAYVHGTDYFATKIASVHPDNPRRGFPTTSAQIAVNDAATGQPVAYMDGTHVTGARTGSVGGLAVRELTDGPVRVAVVGAGVQAQWQVRAIDAATTIESVVFHSPHERSRTGVAETMRNELDVDAAPVDDVGAAVSDVDVVVTATTSHEPVFPGDALAEGTVVVGIGSYTDEMQEIDRTTFDRSSQVFADVPKAVEDIGDIQQAGLAGDDLIPFADLLSGTVDPTDGITIVESVGSVVMDVATASYVVDRARERDVGEEVPF
ncbi:ornithine cyclodeaminase family protein [Halanaeroarchaeum sulfurireducens]|uniref:Ornithine cyclodeaminase n=1 Tax=Halanaeroarchaeum sulfurireducens TaxID=1604004 RepID=A0A0F7PDE1_9EURY|nr:ornithine cyclodeaminase family protein [Halanaeroarchaeum sulfurireducens]AKH97654.1 ornithine cyclodeaminase [Halanaeroarchaeum sulfurireducens]ALG82049.1 ornithine cyclodeaminase [Halanaeroarchaeum sulfurireducens]